MLTLLLALAVSQATVDDDPPPPPPRAPLFAPGAVTPQPPPAALAPDASPQGDSSELQGSTSPPRRSARLLEEEPRVSGGVLLGRIGMSLAIGFAGELTGEFAALGIGALGAATGSVPVFVGAVILGVLVRVGFAALGVALGSALFGRNFGADLRATMPVAAIATGTAILIGTLLTFLLPLVPSLLLVGIPLLAAAVATPLIVQLRKPDESPAAMRDAVPMGGATVAF